MSMWWLIASGSGLIQTDRISWGQGLAEPFQEAGDSGRGGGGGSHEHLKQGSKWEEKIASISWINQYQNPWAKNPRAGGNWEAGEMLQEPRQQDECTE